MSRGITILVSECLWGGCNTVKAPLAGKASQR
jgi:hypothetical protein